MHYLVSDTDIVWRKECLSCNILIEGKLLKKSTRKSCKTNKPYRNNKYCRCREYLFLPLRKLDSCS